MLYTQNRFFLTRGSGKLTDVIFCLYQVHIVWRNLNIGNRMRTTDAVVINWSLWSIAWTLNPLYIVQLHTTNCRLIWAIFLADQTHQLEANFSGVVAFRTTQVCKQHKNETVACVLIFSFYPLSLTLPLLLMYFFYIPFPLLNCIRFIPLLSPILPFPHFLPFFPYHFFFYTK